MTDQPEALRLAECMEELDAQFSFPGACGEAAAELRRLHELNEDLYQQGVGFIDRIAALEQAGQHALNVLERQWRGEANSASLLGAINTLRQTLGGDA